MGRRTKKHLRVVTQAEASNSPEKPLYGVFKHGRRVYLPPSSGPGVEYERAAELAGYLGDAEVRKVYDPEPPEAA